MKKWQTIFRLVLWVRMPVTFDNIRDAVLHLPKGDQMRILSVVAMEVADAHPGIDFQDNVCGGAARIIRTRFPSGCWNRCGGGE